MMANCRFKSICAFAQAGIQRLFSEVVLFPKICSLRMPQITAQRGASHFCQQRSGQEQQMKTELDFAAKET